MEPDCNTNAASPSYSLARLEQTWRHSYMVVDMQWHTIQKKEALWERSRLRVESRVVALVCLIMYNHQSGVERDAMQVAEKEEEEDGEERFAGAWVPLWRIPF